MTLGTRQALFRKKHFVRWSDSWRHHDTAGIRMQQFEWRIR